MANNHISTEPFPPGEYIQDAMDERGWTQEDLADVMGVTRQHINRLLGGVTGVTPETAIALGKAFNTSAELWMNLQTSYELSLAKAEDREIEQRSWLYSRFPVREMQKRNWISKTKDAASIEADLCKFFNIADIKDTPQVPVAARKGTTYSGDSLAHVAWYFKVRSLSEHVSASAYQESNIDSIALDLRRLAGYSQELRRVPRLLADAGIKLVLVEHLSKTRLDGVATWVDGQPVIGLSLRYDRLDNFWFNLMHEIMHIKHKHETTVDIDVTSATNDEIELPEMEQVANREAAEILIPNASLESFALRYGPHFSHRNVSQFAGSQGVHPGIVVGQLQHRKLLPPSHLNKLKAAKCREYIIGQGITSGWEYEPAI